MKIALIGMSGIGKTYWSTQLQERGFLRFPCDSLIEKKLEKNIKTFSHRGIHEVAAWLGKPYEPHYQENSQYYLDYEKETLEEICDTIEKTPHQNIVIDTTGSVIYMEKSLLKKLSSLTTIVYLHTPESVKTKMFDIFSQEPKPVIWGKLFSPHPGESNQAALIRCYANLLDDRIQKYTKLADITLDFDTLRNPHFTLDQFLDIGKRGGQVSIIRH